MENESLSIDVLYNRYNYASPSANLVTGTPYQTWYPNTSATHHFTNSLQNLNIATKYIGVDEVKVGNDAGLFISHIGSSLIYSPSTSFRLNNLLHAPEVTKNLLSVRKFACNNSIFFEFHPFNVYIKDLAMGKLLL